jgi:hypothetical protein
MKLHHFGLWFCGWSSNNWSTAIPQTGLFHIYYDGRLLGAQFRDFNLWVYEGRPHIINLKSYLTNTTSIYHRYDIGRPLTIDDFEIIENPNYKGNI